MLGKMLEKVHKNSPIVHCITNYVTVNDCANILLACGASPIMADDISEVADITAISSALDINIGTLNSNTIPSMFSAGKKANELSHPILLDPVGAGASTLRTETALNLMHELNITVVRGNMSEIKALFSTDSNTRGVDVSEADAITASTLESAAEMIKRFAATTNTILVVTGETDIVADKERVFIIHNGHNMMKRITGAGCMLSAMMTAYLAANPNNYLEAAAAAVCAIGICGERAFTRLDSNGGNSTFRNYLIDEIYKLTPEILEEGAKYELR